MSNSESPNSLGDAGGSLLPGQALEQAREQQGLSLAEVSDRIKISAVQLTALEHGDIEQLPGLAFARGYVRTYGRFLGLDADALVQDFNVRYGESSQRQVRSINRVKPQAHLGDPMIRVSVIVFVMILLGSSVWWWQTQMEGEVSLVGALSLVSSALIKSDTADVPATPVAVIAVERVDLPGVTGSDGVSVGRDQEGEPEYLSDAEIARLARELETEPAPTKTPIATKPDGSPTVSISKESSESEAAASTMLVIRFSSECWVSIKDTRGKVIFASLMQDGNTLERNFDSLPVELLIGQVGAVAESEFRGQPLDLVTSNKKGVARLTLK
ncbi:MAG: RodZ domain-containing protein [Motiliproteus sp.]